MCVENCLTNECERVYVGMGSSGPSDPGERIMTESKCVDTGPVVWVSDDDPVEADDHTDNVWEEAVNLMNGKLQGGNEEEEDEEGDDEEENEECDEDGEYALNGVSSVTNEDISSYTTYEDRPVGQTLASLAFGVPNENGVLSETSRSKHSSPSASKVKPMIWTTSETTPCSSSQGRDRRAKGPTYRLDQVVPCPVTLTDLPVEQMHPGTLKDLEEDRTGECFLVDAYRASALNSISTQVLDMTLGCIAGVDEPVGICGRVEMGIFNVFDDEHTDPSLGLRGRPKPTLSGAIGPERNPARTELSSLRGVTVNYAIVTVREARMLTAKAKLLVQSSDARAGNNVMEVRDPLDRRHMLSDETVIPISRPSPTGNTAVEDRLLLLFACKYCGLPCIYGTTIHPIVRYVLQRVLAAVPNRSINKGDLSQKAVHYILKKFTFVFPEVYWPRRSDGTGVLTRHLEWIEIPNVDANGDRLPSRRRKFDMFPFGRSKDKGVPRMLLGKRRHRTITVTMNGRSSRYQAPSGVKPLTEFFQKKSAKRKEDDTLSELQRRRYRQQHPPRHTDLPISLPVPIKGEITHNSNGTNAIPSGTATVLTEPLNGVYSGTHTGHDSHSHTPIHDGEVYPFGSNDITINTMEVPPELLGDAYENFDITQFLPNDLSVGDTSVGEPMDSEMNSLNEGISASALNETTENNRRSSENLDSIMERLTRTYNSLGDIISELSLYMADSIG